ncbi:Dynein heavy chain 2, axonemal [Chelonia mydas]|uniref:Dynein heavy chain 2, axonemal n=1 Tax=Chelonia mydas TaxID=8469 RepID=M7BD00_CHEMY|nr:Dynein heavy chain 2, axonemal [Chelonia mydas]
MGTLNAVSAQPRVSVRTSALQLGGLLPVFSVGSVFTKPYSHTVALVQRCRCRHITLALVNAWIWMSVSSEKPTHSSPTAMNTLVIMLLTDRCYVTLTTALHLHRGGSPKGPASTGKTETVKDLGKALGMYVIVVNCSNGLDYKSRGHVFLGLAQTGACGCFDAFNCINIEMLSVVAQQILSVLSALAASVTSFTFEGHKIKLVWSCAIFITMNRGARHGCAHGKLLANVYTLYSLAVQQLSKQDRYDFGLWALTSLLRYAGKKRRVHPDITNKEQITGLQLLPTMKDEESTLRSSLGIFKMGRLASKDLQKLETVGTPPWHSSLQGPSSPLLLRGQR